MKCINVLIFFLFIGCGTKNNPEKIDIITPNYWPNIKNEEFKSYTKEYIHYSEVYTKRPPNTWLGSGTIDFGETPQSNISGICNTSYNLDPSGTPDGIWEILINKKHWDNYDEEQKTVLMYHELGHCLNFFKHRDERSGIYPKSIMNSYVFGTDRIFKLFDEYVKELFTKNWRVVEDKSSLLNNLNSVATKYSVVHKCTFGDRVK